MSCRRAREEALEQGIGQGMNRLGALVALLLNAGRFDDAKRVSEDAPIAISCSLSSGCRAKVGIFSRDADCPCYH